ncbi:MAG: ABC transporter permease [Deltaproteobacteria bacterium]|nr:MAG: ABC transporter permease [Deltaproteobacteria bacterium]
MSRLGAGTAVIAREAVRSSRRWQTYGLRFGFASLLFALVLAAWTEQIHTIMDDPAAAARLGHGLFTLYSAAQIFLVAIIAPVVVGQAISEEREDGTLQLLTLTRLSAAEILWSKLTSRLLILGTLVLSSLPVLSLTLTFGGVGVWQAVNAVSVTLLMVVLLGAVGGFAALTSKGGVAGLVSAAGYTFTVLGVGPTMLFVGYRMFDASMHGQDWFSPASAFNSNDPSALLVWVVYLPALLGLAIAAAPIFRMATSDDPEEQEFGHLSPDIWQVERFKRTTFGVLVVWATLTLIFGLSSKLVPEPVWTMWRVAQASGLTFVLTVVWVFAFQALTQLVANLLRARAVEVDPEYASTWRRTTLAWRRRVWANPIAWREVVTRGQGAGAVAGRMAVPALLLVGCPMLLLSDFDDDMFVFLGLTGLVASLALTGTVVGGSMVSERRAGTLELLATTTISPSSVLAGKLFATALHTLPLFATAFLLIFLGVFEPWEGRYMYDPYCHYTAVVASPQQTVLFKGALLAAWTPMAWLSMTAAAMLASTRVRPASLGWGGSLAASLGWFTVPVIALVAVMQREAQPLVRLWTPWLSDSWSTAECAPRVEWFYSIGLHAVIAMSLLALLRLRFRAWTT